MGNHKKIKNLIRNEYRLKPIPYYGELFKKSKLVSRKSKATFDSLKKENNHLAGC
jgi:hypothetical protein